MFRIQSRLITICVFGVMLSAAVGQDQTNKAFLLNVGKGQVPNDTGMDDQSVLTVVNLNELGGKALKVPLAAEDSFGVKKSGVPDWTKYSQLRLNAFNPSSKAIELELVVIHSQSKEYETRVVQPVTLKPGKSEVAIKIKDLKNVNGSVPKLGSVTRWYFADVSKLQKTFFVGDIWLEGGDASNAVARPSAPTSAAAATAGNATQPMIGYRVKGSFGATAIDLTLTPFVVAPANDPSAGTAAVSPSTGSRPTDTSANGKIPTIRNPISFDTPEADAIVSSLEIFPADNALKVDISDWPLHPNSSDIIESIGRDKPMRCNPDMGYVLVPPNQKKVNVEIGEIAEESDKGPFPVPGIVPIEDWPVSFQRNNSPLTLDQVQRNVNNEDLDRHAIVVDPVNRLLFEFYQMQKTPNGWKATQASIFDLKSNKLRPDGWTSADAAGLPIFPLVVRYDELARGVVQHALRVTVSKTRNAYVYPATHFASPHSDENLPRMGERIRLRKDYDVARHSPEVQTILNALKTYGMLVADNGIDWAVSITPDPRIPELHADLQQITGSDFEVVEPPKGYQQPE